MEATLTVGIENDETFAITEEMCTGHTGTAVLSTPAMIQLMEAACAGAAHPHLGATETTVGIHVCVSHVAGSVVGEDVVVRAALKEIAKGRFLTFDVSARVGDRLLGEGTHQRAVLDTARQR
jgi:fluoroacetyl-CoA thioesterase